MKQKVYYSISLNMTEKVPFYRFKANIRLIRLWWLGQKEPVSN